MTKLTGKEIAAAVPPGWTYLLDAIATRVGTADFATGLALVDAIGAAAEAADHHPDLTLHYTSVEIRLTSHDVRAVTGRDIRLAHTISALAAEAGLSLSHAGVSQLELALDTPEAPKVLPFWQAVFGAEHRGSEELGDELRDPAGALPTIWFQRSGSDEPRQRWHHDLWLDPAEVQPRIDAALAAGGTLVSDQEAPSFWVLADPEGNRVCLCTWQDRT
jgi:4a-hydroxytetrahydrobiopterin dehydratase